MDKKYGLTVCCPQETNFRFKNTNRLKVKGWKIYYEDSNQIWAGVAILVSGKIDFKTKIVTRDKIGAFCNDKNS